MKVKFPIFLSLLLFSTSAFTIYSLQSWTIEEDYNIRFDGRNAKGTFSGLSGTIQFDPAALDKAKMDVSVKTNTISTGNNTKNKHARGKNWFHVEKYPQIRFQSKFFRKTQGSFEVKGILSIRDISKEVTIPFQFEPQGSGAVFSGTFSIDRKEFGIIGPIGNFTVGNDFKIQMKVPVK